MAERGYFDDEILGAEDLDQIKTPRMLDESITDTPSHILHTAQFIRKGDNKKIMLLGEGHREGEETDPAIVKEAHELYEFLKYIIEESPKSKVFFENSPFKFTTSSPTMKIVYEQLKKEFGDLRVGNIDMRAIYAQDRYTPEEVEFFVKKDTFEKHPAFLKSAVEDLQRYINKEDVISKDGTVAPWEDLLLSPMIEKDMLEQIDKPTERSSQDEIYMTGAHHSKNIDNVLNQERNYQRYGGTEIDIFSPP